MSAEDLALAAKGLFLRALKSLREGSPANSVVADLCLASRYLPQHAPIWFHLALAYLRMGIHPKAMSAVRKAAQLNPSNPRYANLAAWIATAAESPEAANCREKLDPNSPAHLFLEGVAALLDGASLGACDFRIGQEAHEGAAELIFLRGLEASRRWDSIPKDAGPVVLPAGPFADLRPGEAFFRAAVANDPENPVLQLTLGNVELQLGNFDAAVSCLEKANRTVLPCPLLPRTLACLYLRRALEQERQGNASAAAKSIEDASHVAPDLTLSKRRLQESALASRANDLSARGDLPAAIPLWKQLEGGPDTPPAVFHNLALAYERLNDPEKAAIYRKRWIAVSRADMRKDPALAAEAWARLGRNLMDSGQPRPAAHALRQVLDVAADDTDARELLIDICLAERECREALRHLAYLQQNLGETSQRWTQIGVARLTLRDTEGADQAWNRAIALEPGNTAAASYLLQALADRLDQLSPRQYSLEGLNLIQRMIDRLPGHFGPRLMLARYFFTFNDRNRGMRTLEEALRTEPEKEESWLKALDMIVHFGGSADVHTLAKRILAVFPHRPLLQVHVGVELLLHSQPRLAISHFRAAMLHSTGAQIPLKIAYAYFECHRPRKVEEYVRKALEREPDNCEAHALLAALCMELGRQSECREELRIVRALAEKSGDASMLEFAGDLNRLLHKGERFLRFLEES